MDRNYQKKKQRLCKSQICESFLTKSKKIILILKKILQDFLSQFILYTNKYNRYVIMIYNYFVNIKLFLNEKLFYKNLIEIDDNYRRICNYTQSCRHCIY